jgi:hypothetical protein
MTAKISPKFRCRGCGCNCRVVFNAAAPPIEPGLCGLCSRMLERTGKFSGNGSFHRIVTGTGDDRERKDPRLLAGLIGPVPQRGTPTHRPVNVGLN